jgi:hypothetical protein
MPINLSIIPSPKFKTVWSKLIALFLILRKISSIPKREKATQRIIKSGFI